jgi:hypothetical protein
VAPDPDLYGPPERDNEDPQQDDDWEALLELYATEDCPECGLYGGAHVTYCSLKPTGGRR